MKQKNPNSNVCSRYVVDDVGDARRAPQGVILAVSVKPILKKPSGQKTPQISMFFCASQAKSHGTVVVVVCCCLLLLLVLLLLVVCCWLSVVCCLLLLLLPLQLFLSLDSGRKSSNWLCFRVFLRLSEQKNTVNADVVCASEAQNHGYNVFCFW